MHRLSLLTCLLFFACREGESPPPSIILISIDTLRADHVGCYGYERDTTPTLDALAEESLLFERCYASAPWTLVSHMTMLTGLYPDQHGVVAKRHALNPKVPLLAERLKERGYQTFGVYFPGWIGARHGFDRGFDRFESHGSAEEAGELVRKLIATRNRKRPTFLFLHLFDVHCAPLDNAETTFYEPPEPFDRFFLEDAAERLADTPLNAGTEAVVGGLRDPEKLEALTALYDGGIRYVDTKLDGWFREWRADGFFDESIVIVTSDHGESLGQRGGVLTDHGGLWEEGLRVPLLVRFPDGRHAGERVAEPVSHVDLTPTLLREAGVAFDERLPGYDLLQARPEERVMRAARPPIDVWLSWPWKLVRGEGGGGTAYDLRQDPEEAQPIRARKDERFDELFQELKRSYEDELGETRNPRARPVQAHELDAEVKRRLDALGYAGDTSD